jgi:hypothetical protein
MSENTVLRWVIAAVVAIAIVALLAYARGDDGDLGRSPEREDSLPALIADVDSSGATGA